MLAKKYLYDTKEQNTLNFYPYKDVEPKPWIFPSILKSI